MSVYTQSPEDQHRRLQQFLYWLQPLDFGVSALLLIMSLFFPNDDTLLAGVTLFCYGLFLTWARLQLRRGKIQLTVTIICVGLFAEALVLAWMSPTSVKILVLLPIMATTVALPYVNAQALRRLMYASWLTTIAMTVVTELDNTDPSRALIPDGLQTIVGMAAASALILLLLWQFSSRLTATLAETRAANSALQEAHVRLEVQHAQLLHDVAERQLAEEALRQSEEQFRLTFEIAPIGMAVLTTDGRFVRVNQSFCATIRYTADEILGRSFADITHPDDLASNLALDQKLLRGELPFFQMEKRYITKGSQIISVLLHVALVRDMQGRPLHFISQVVDMTEQKRAEEQRHEIERKLLETQKLESIGLLAGGIAHDFNNLLMGILGNTGLALVALPPASPARATITQIELAAQRAADLTRQMLAYAGKGRLMIETIDLNQLISEIAQLLNASVAKNASLHYQLAPELPPIEGDITQIRQVVMNLIVNASEAIGDQPGEIRISTAAHQDGHAGLDGAFPADLAEGQYVTLEVADTGAGMDTETLGKIFEPFFTTKFTGRGLGLAAVQGIVRSHGGALTVDSAPRQGTTFRILLPAAQATEVHDGQLLTVDSEPDEEPTPEPSPAGAGTILVIDDEAEVRMVAERMLAHFGYEVLLARGGLAGIELLRNHLGTIGCVLLDLTMPHMDGEQVFHALRAIDPGVPIILMSGYSEQEVGGRFTGLGLAGFMQKPFTLDALQAKVRRALAQVVT
jgi:two-component system, cell cycle sensor histidine kinase and response regulator CckA